MVQIPSPAYLWSQQEKKHNFLYDHVFMVKKRDLNPTSVSESRCGHKNISRKNVKMKKTYYK